MIFLLLVACNNKEIGKGQSDAPTLSDYAGSAQNLLMFTPLEEPEGSSRMLLIGEENWELRNGDFWEDAEPGDHWGWALEEAGLRVGADLLLPASLSVGSEEEGAKITADGAFSTWYGTFPDTRTVTLDSGAWSGTLVFAKNVGLIRFSRGGDWDLVYYEYGWEPRGDTGG